MGGIGKSTLAKVLYNHAEVTQRFERRAWVVVSEQFDPEEVIMQLVQQLLEPSEDKLTVLQVMEKLQLPSLKDMLYERLKGRRYFIVVDDVWQQQDWELLVSAFPDEEDKASRLIVTSRNHSIPRGARYVHEMKTLDNDRSWELLLKTAFNDSTYIGTCPPELEDIGREILTKCNGLPLAITVVGGLLLEQGQSRSGWEKVLQGINSHFERSGDSSVQAILELSYHALPPHLKSCFLCLGFFKEDAAISADKLVHIWVSEGLVPQEGVNTMEDTSRDYLEELINRNMVQVRDLSKKDGRVKKCQIHDLLRELSIRKAKEEITFEILKDRRNSAHQSLGRKSRHCAIYCSTESFNIFSTRSVNKHLRSLIFHEGGDGDVDCSPSFKWKSFRLLRVLDMEGLGLRKLSDTIGKLVGLRYLGLRDNRLRKLPSSLGRLKNLQVLDILGNQFVEVPNVIWKMDSLRHIYFLLSWSNKPLKMDTLKNLQTLKYIRTSQLMLGHLTQMTSLRKLGIILPPDQSDVNEICTSLAMLENLVSLELAAPVDPIQSLDGLVNLHHLTQLKVTGEVSELPRASNFPPNLSSLTLNWPALKEDPMPILEKLPKLLYLKLGGQAYPGGEMVISQKGFPSLKVLQLQKLFKLRNIKVEKGGMSELKQLKIDCCPELERLPEELKFMSNLQELTLAMRAENASKFQDENSDIISSMPSVTLELI